MATLQKIKFRDFITLQRGFDLPKKDMRNGPYAVVGSTSIIGYHDEFKTPAPGVVTGRSGSLGAVQYIKTNYWPHNTSLWVKDFKGNYPRYIYYFLNTLDLKRFNSGVGVPTLNRNDLDNLDIAIHTPLTQCKIAAILSAYDDLIENNLRRIKILEEMAQMIYREWFVNFRFQGHEKVKMVKSEMGMIPEGWEVKKLKDIVSNNRKAVKAGFHLHSLRYVPIDIIPRKSLALLESKSWEEAQSSLISFSKGDVLFGAMRSYFHKVVIAPFDGVTRTTCFVFSPTKREYYSYAVLTLFQENTIAYSNQHSRGSTMPYAVWEGSLSEMPILLPSKELLSKFHNSVLPMLESICSVYFKNNNFRKTRDLLLPKLISGEIDVEDLDINTEGLEQ